MKISGVAGVEKDEDINAGEVVSYSVMVCFMCVNAVVYERTSLCFLYRQLEGMESVGCGIRARKR